MKIKKKKILKFLILIIIISILIYLTFFIYQKIEKNKFKKLLEENDASNYEFTEIVNDTETTGFVRDKILLSKSGNITTWVNEMKNRRIILDDEYKTAIVDNNDDDLRVNSLNYTYINDYFENSNQVFKYLGKENEFYKIQFKEKGSKKITWIYINIKNNIVEKMIQNVGNFELVTEYKIEKNKVSKDEVELPNVEGYKAYDSVDSKKE